MKRVYIAGPLHRAAEARELAASLGMAGVLVASTWHIGDPDEASDRALSREARQQAASTSFLELWSATHVVLLADPRGRGSLFEAGFAVGICKPLIIVGHWHDHTLMLDHPARIWALTHADVVTALAGFGCESTRMR